MEKSARELARAARVDIALNRRDGVMLNRLAQGLFALLGLGVVYVLAQDLQEMAGKMH